jgi:hypothetical protein
MISRKLNFFNNIFDQRWGRVLDGNRGKRDGFELESQSLGEIN